MAVRYINGTLIPALFGAGLLCLATTADARVSKAEVQGAFQLMLPLIVAEVLAVNCDSLSVNERGKKAVAASLDKFITQNRSFPPGNVAVRFDLFKRRSQTVDGRLLVAESRLKLIGSTNGSALAASRTQEDPASYEQRKTNAGRIEFSRRHP